MNEHEAFSLFQSLGRYLKTEVETSFGTIQKQVRRGYQRGTIEAEGHIVGRAGEKLSNSPLRN